ncbi:hypothetical protein HID58_085438 [Brassica napus]|uniref:Uncharacterized protein n=1 Tax=Brassica napus TaxID=3708 RepID=A0ABQ7XMM3_BRANA|nr:hypothetical protein HID58_085438 [Brassica napus]
MELNSKNSILVLERFLNRVVNVLGSSYQISLLLDNAKDPSTVDFGNISGPSMVERTCLNKPMCAAFGLDGKVMFAGEVKPYVCAVKTNGHFGLVITDDQDSSKSAGLVVAAAVVTAKKRGRRAKREDMERKTYEEEALRVVTMVGHSRVLVAICYKDIAWLRFLFI